MNVENNGAEVPSLTSPGAEEVELFPQQDDRRLQLAETFRTRLNAIIGFSELLALESLTANGQNDLKQVLKAARDLLGVVDQELGPVVNTFRIQTCHLLYIEDDMANVTLVERILELRPGVSMKHAALGKRGIEMAKTENPRMV